MRFVNKVKQVAKKCFVMPRVNIRMPQVTLPTVHISFPFRIVGMIFKNILTTLFIITGGVGLFISYIDPTKWITPILPFKLENIFWTGAWLNVNTVLVQDIVGFFNLNLIPTLVGSIILILMGFLLHIHSFKTWGKKIKATPMAVVRLPIHAYKKIVIWRNWILAKIEYLNSESQKWKTIFNIAKSPYTLLRAFGLSPQMAISLLAVGSTAGTGVIVNETLLAEKSFANGDSGYYEAPMDLPYFTDEKQNTLRIDLGNTPVREITIENVSVGTAFTGSALPSGEQNVVQISGNPTTSSPSFSGTRLEVGELIFEKSRCKKLTLTDIQAHTLIVIGNASDGQSIAPSPGTSRMRAIGGGHHQADAMVTSGGTYDRIWIQAPTSGVNGKVGTLKLSNLLTKGGECVLSKMNVGTMRIELNEIGQGNGFATKEFVIATNVTAANMTISDNVEVTIAEPATQ
tara:strand:+ start:1334 stop:2707 length:1374 start_codon:yes stop_codon:yes gene_type:complete